MEKLRPDRVVVLGTLGHGVDAVDGRGQFIAQAFDIHVVEAKGHGLAGLQRRHRQRAEKAIRWRTVEDAHQGGGVGRGQAAIDHGQVDRAGICV